MVAELLTMGAAKAPSPPKARVRVEAAGGRAVRGGELSLQMCDACLLLGRVGRLPVVGRGTAGRARGQTQVKSRGDQSVVIPGGGGSGRAALDVTGVAPGRGKARIGPRGAVHGDRQPAKGSLAHCS